MATGAFLVLAGNAHSGTPSPANSETMRRSEQFVVHDTRKFGRSLAAFADSENPELVQLEPGPLLLSAERISEALARQLRVTPRGAGKIHCYLYAPLRNNENIVLLSTLYADGWQYRLQIPDDLERTTLVRGILQSLLLELANRGTRQKSAEIPPWLLEGLTLQVLADVGPELVLNSVPTNTVRRSLRLIRGADPVAEARAYFRTHSPLSFAQLSEPVLQAPPGEPWRRYQFSCQLLVAELLESSGGRVKLIRMLRALPDCWNWQTAFLAAFEFPSLLDVEKWWAVGAVASMGREAIHLSSSAAYLARLDEILTVPAQVRLSTNAVPVRTEATLAQVISGWDYAQQRPVLEQKLHQLALLRTTSSRQLASLIEGYWACLHSYLVRRDQSGRAPQTKHQVNLPGPLLAQETTHQLTALDRQRAILREQLRLPGTGEVAQQR
ncbi:MAG: hypothetical protein L0Z50_24360 [Verrucomicrobiales bacterium]|nr:hypothetical protein [Verrucomicrobiales bacterium]